jgi:hypothetical protein
MIKARHSTEQARPSVPGATGVGLFIVLFGMLIARQIILWLWPDPTLASAIWKEVLMWLCAAASLLIIKKGERLPLSSVGIGTSPVKQSVLWGAVITVICALVATVLVIITHFHGGSMGEVFARLPTRSYLSSTSGG